jgi:DNA-binding transcriptional regulator YiaG
MKTKLKEMSERLNLTDKQMAKYIGVPLNTYLKWVKGEREPNTSAIRLIEVLEMIELFCPNLTKILINQE